MSLSDAAIVLAVLLAATVVVGLIVGARQNRPRPHDLSEIVQPERLGAETLGESATLLQFSSENGPRCPEVHRTLSAIAADRDGVLHLDIDLTGRPDIGTHFRVAHTPTTLLLDGSGLVQARFGGTPSRDVIELELNRVAAGTPVA